MKDDCEINRRAKSDTRSKSSGPYSHVYTRRKRTCKETVNCFDGNRNACVYVDLINLSLTLFFSFSLSRLLHICLSRSEVTMIQGGKKQGRHCISLVPLLILFPSAFYLFLTQMYKKTKFMYNRSVGIVIDREK